MSYKELKEKFMEEVAKIDLSKMSIYELNAYADLLKKISDLPSEDIGERASSGLFDFGFLKSLPKTAEREE